VFSLNIDGLFHFVVQFLMEVRGFEGMGYMISKVRGTWFRECLFNSFESTEVQHMGYIVSYYSLRIRWRELCQLSVNIVPKAKLFYLKPCQSESQSP